MSTKNTKAKQAVSCLRAFLADNPPSAITRDLRLLVQLAVGSNSFADVVAFERESMVNTIHDLQLFFETIDLPESE